MLDVPPTRDKKKYSDAYFVFMLERMFFFTTVIYQLDDREEEIKKRREIKSMDSFMYLLTNSFMRISHTRAFRLFFLSLRHSNDRIKSSSKNN